MKMHFVCAGALLAASAASGQSLKLLPGARIGTGTGVTRGLAVGDLNSDGLLDIVSSGAELAAPDGIDVMLGMGGGAFSTPTPYAGARGLLAIRDVTEDGTPDVISMYIDHFSPPTPSVGHVWVRVGHGDGTLGESIDAIVGEGGFAYDDMSLSDLDGDGHTDLVMLDSSCECVRMAFGNGDGTFGRFQSLSVIGSPSGLAVDDFDQDGTLDITLVLAGITTLLVTLAGQGNGAFEDPIYTLAPNDFFITDLAAADLDGDTLPDIATIGQAFDPDTLAFKGIVRLFRGLGHGDFVWTASHDLAASPWDVRIVDLDKDALLDVLVCGSDWLPSTPAVEHQSAGLFVLKSLGGFDFQAPIRYAVGGEPISAAIGDLDGDGAIDAVLGQQPPYTASFFTLCDLRIAFGAEGGAFVTMTRIELDSQPLHITTADLDQDGDLDIVAGMADGCFAALTNADGTSQPPIKVLDTGAFRVIAADMNGDHVPDLVFEQGAFVFSLKIALGLGGGTTFGAPTTFSFGSIASDIAAVDFDGDGDLDIIATHEGDGHLTACRNHGDGTFDPMTSYPTSGQPSAIAAAFLDHDAFADVAVANGSAQSVGVFRGSASGTLSTVSLVSVAGTPNLIAAGDVDRDGNIDLVAASTQPPALSLLKGAGDGSFSAAPIAAFPTHCSAIKVIDLDRDGALDIVALHSAADTISFFRGDGTGSFASPASFFTVANPMRLAAADFDRDGFTDLAIMPGEENAIWVELNGSSLWSHLGHALTPPSGKQPGLTGAGDPIPDQLVTLTVTNVPAPSLGLLLMGLDTVMQPYKGGVLVPRADVAAPIRPAFPLDGRWPKGLDAGTPVYFQAWFATPGQGGAVSATNALVTIAQ